jgi:hypothetical protein
MLALVLVSVVVGGLLGGAALYLYQNHSRDEAPAASSTSQPETSVPASGPSPASTTEAVGTSPSAPAQREEHAANASGNKEAGASDSDNKETGAVSARDAENVPAAEQRRETDEGARVGAPKRGKKGERDEEIGRPRRPADNAAGDRQLSRADATPDRRESRRVDTIFYRPRRAARPEGTRRETAGDADRLRRIFEGQPE